MNVHLLGQLLVVGLTASISASTPLPAPAPIETGCSIIPHDCGYPDGMTSGVPSWMTLKNVPGQVSSGPGWYYDPRGWVEVDGDGAVLSGLNIPCSLDISASNVTIKDVQVETSGQSSFGISLRHTRNVTIINSNIEGEDEGSRRLMVGVKDVYGDSVGTSVLNNNIARTGTGVQIFEGLIQGNYIHDMGYIRGDHVNGITVNGGTEPLTIQDNTIFVDRDQTDAVSLFQDSGVEANKVIRNNLLAGGGYAIYGGDKNGGPAARNIVIENNLISTFIYPSGGFWGPVAFFSPGPGNVWSGNAWDTGLMIPVP